MNSIKATKRALISSVLALFLCFSMLLGTTYAWFTDSVSSANNIIKAGNLDVELYYQLEGQADWKPIHAGTNVFKDNTHWEPGHTEVVRLKVANEGSLFFKYQLGVNVEKEVATENTEGQPFLLSNYIQYAIIDGAQTYVDSQEAMMAAELSVPKTLNTAYSIEEILAPTKDDALYSNEKIVTMVVYMPDRVVDCPVGNATINLGINLFATQYVKEEDSFDGTYDQEAGKTVFTLDAVHAKMAENEDVTLLGCATPNGVIEIPADYTGKLTLQNCTLASIRVAEATTFATRGAEAEVTNIEILGNVKIVATEDGMSAITGKNLNITGNGHLTAIGKGNHAYGIGGDDTASICIEGITIDSVVGGHAGAFGEDTKYYKDAPEGGAAIGSGLDGAVIALNKVTIKEAIGGSKAAGIGARYHTGVTVNITDSTIAGVEGGVSAAGIGGSRVSSGADESGTTINITNSTITAKGGAYGAGIGSGYDTHCQSKQPLCTINIMSSTINATGGRYAAGVGTGYHHAALTGEIKDSKVTALSGDKYYKSEYTIAMDVGFGVVDPVREGQQTDSSLIYQGQELVIPGTMTVVANAQELAEAVTGGETMLYLLDGVYDIYACHGKTLELYGGKGAVINIVGLGRSEAGGQLDYGLDSATVTFNGLTIRTNGETYAGFSNLKAVYNNCTFESTYCVTGDSEFNNCTINMDGDWYTVWTADGTGKVKIVIDGVEVN